MDDTNRVPAALFSLILAITLGASASLARADVVLSDMCGPTACEPGAIGNTASAVGTASNGSSTGSGSASGGAAGSAGSAGAASAGSTTTSGSASAANGSASLSQNAVAPFILTNAEAQSIGLTNDPLVTQGIKTWSGQIGNSLGSSTSGAGSSATLTYSSSGI